jgi:hypothetical protein
VKKVIEWAVGGFFITIALVIVFVKAGKGGGTSGGDQAASVIKASSGGIANIATSLEGS